MSYLYSFILDSSLSDRVYMYIQDHSKSCFSPYYTIQGAFMGKFNLHRGSLQLRVLTLTLLFTLGV